MIESFDAKHPDAIETLTVDLTDRMNKNELIVSASTSISLKSGNDPSTNLNDMLVGNPSFLGNLVSQSVRGGVNGCYYYIIYTVVTTQQRLVITCIIPVSIGA